jgi:4-amino-4-deoxy-L-arabinose transferase-like glycosyltransferase
MKNFFVRYGVYLLGLVLTFLFVLYTYDLTRNPPGFYVDESAFAYNAYSIAKTGASEFGVRWPLFVQNFPAPFTVFVNPVHIYLLAAFLLFLPPSIYLARLLSALAGFEAGLLLGLLALKLSGKKSIGVIVGLTALITPWFFEFSRWFSDASYYPLVLTLFLIALYRANLKEHWGWRDAIWIGLTLGLVTYTYSIGRLLGPLLGLGLVCLITSRQRMFSVLKAWVVYGITFIPFVIFYLRHPTALSSRFMTLSYLHTETTLQGIVVRFIARYFQDLSLYGLLTRGDTNPRHHVPGATGSFLLATFVLSIIGFGIVLLHHRYEAYWRFIIFGIFASVIPGALTNDPFHTGRMIAYPVFLLVFTVPALEWLMGLGRHATNETGPDRRKKTSFVLGFSVKQVALGVLLAGTIGQAIYFQTRFWRDGYDRPYAWDATYKEAYDLAISETSRPIYLVDGKWGPGYIHALWYATLEGRSTPEFVHLPYQVEPPSGALVISSATDCVSCVILLDNGQYKVYRKF